MSIQNRRLQKGRVQLKQERKSETLLGKIACWVAGHKKVTFKTEKAERDYCISCWKEFNKEKNTTE